MQELSRLPEWRSSGFITVDQEEAIAREEGAVDSTSSDRRMLEAMTYLGAVLFLIGALIITFDVAIPEDIFFGEPGNTWGAFFVALITAVVLGGAAWVISERNADEALARGVGLTALAAWVAFFAAEMIFVIDLVDFGRATTLVVGLSLLVVAYPIYRWRPGAPTHWALATGSVITIAGILVLLFDGEDVLGSALGFSSDTTVFLVSGLLLTGFGLGWMHLADRRILVPRNLGYVLGGLVAFIGSQLFANIAQGWIVITLGLGIFIALSGVWRARTLLMAIGTVYIVYGLAGLLELIFEDSAVSAGVVMLLAGAAALAAVIVRSDSVISSGMRMPETKPGEDPPIE